MAVLGFCSSLCILSMARLDQARNLLGRHGSSVLELDPLGRRLFGGGSSCVHPWIKAGPTNAITYITKLAIYCDLCKIFFFYEIKRFTMLQCFEPKTFKQGSCHKPTSLSLGCTACCDPQ